tara:strand:+ start:2629 stop:2745 length:117 start_codon:yes stop_codon:yes gene_type:complete
MKTIIVILFIAGLVYVLFNDDNNNIEQNMKEYDKKKRR